MRAKPWHTSAPFPCWTLISMRRKCGPTSQEGEAPRSDTVPYLGIKQLGLQAPRRVRKLLSLDAAQGNYLGRPTELRNLGIRFLEAAWNVSMSNVLKLSGISMPGREKKMVYEKFPDLTGRITILKMTLSISRESTRNGKRDWSPKKTMTSKSRNAGLKWDLAKVGLAKTQTEYDLIKEIRLNS